MSVFIRGLNLPAEPMILILHPDGNISTEDFEIGANAKAIELPAHHGRLIDADEFIRQLSDGSISGTIQRGIGYRMSKMPTIIEAEEGDG